MKKILSIEDAVSSSQQLRKQNKSIVVVGGIFDILHLGHIKFLEESKKYGDYLFVLLEEDSKAKKEKGNKRPLNSQKDRAKILSTLQSVSYIVILKNMTNNKLYDRLMVELQPNVIATTYGDPHVEHKERQAKLTQSKVIYVIKKIIDHSTTKYVKLIK